MSSCPEIYVNSLNWSVEILNIAPNICPNLRSLNLFSARSDFNDSVHSQCSSSRAKCCNLFFLLLYYVILTHSPTKGGNEVDLNEIKDSDG